MTQIFQKGQTVWAKMKGFPHWPGIVTDPPKSMAKKSPNPHLRCVYFFGTKNYGWVELSNLMDYESNRDYSGKPPKNNSMRQAVDDIEGYLKNGDSNLVIDNNDPFDQLITASSTPKVKPASESKSLKRKRADDSEKKSLKPKKKNSESVLNSSASFSVNGSHKSFSSFRYGLNRAIKKKYIEPLNLNAKSEELIGKKIKPSDLQIGFVGLGVVGSRLVKNLLHSNHRVLIWNRTEEKCQQFLEFGAEIASSPYDVLSDSDILFLSLENEDAVIDVLFAAKMIFAIKPGNKSIINLTPISAEKSEHISDLLEAYNCRYLGVRLVGTPEEADKGLLFSVAAGNETLYEDSKSCFDAFTLKSSFIGSDFKKLSNVYSVFNTFSTVVSSGISETIALSKKTGISVSQCFGLAALSPFLASSFMEKYKKCYEEKGEGAFPAFAPLLPEAQVPYVLKSDTDHIKENSIISIFK